jgi:hypothetical protein
MSLGAAPNIVAPPLYMIYVRFSSFGVDHGRTFRGACRRESACTQEERNHHEGPCVALRGAAAAESAAPARFSSGEHVQERFDYPEQQHRQISIMVGSAITRRSGRRSRA